MEEMELNGHWWLPTDYKNQIFGNLKFIPGEKAILTLSDFSKDIFEPLKAKDLEFHKIFLGKLSDGKKITLYNCRLFQSTGNSGLGKENVLMLSFNVDYIFVGHHFEKEEDIKFKLVSVQYSYLDEWINKPLSMNHDNKINEKPRPIQLTKMSDYKVFIDFDWSAPFYSFREFTIEQKAFVLVESFKLDKEWKEYENLIKFLQNFLTLAVMKPVYPLKIRGKIRKNKSVFRKIGGRVEKDYDSYPDIDIYITYLKLPNSLEDIKSWNMLFLYGDVKNQIKRFLQNWIVNSSLFKLVYNMYFSTLYNDGIFLENQFLNIVMAIEAYHRSKTSNKDLDEYSHNKRVSTIIAGTPDIYKEWIKQGLEYSNEPNLRKRLNEILAPYKDVFGGKKRINSFIFKVLKNRNYLVHPDINREINYEQLFYTTKILGVVFEIYALEHMGFEREYIKKLINKKKRKSMAFQYMRMK
jgi:hypothetical protein